MIEFETFLNSTAGIITSVTIIIGGFASFATWTKKGIKKLFKEQLEPFTKEIKNISDDIITIKDTNNAQMDKINQLLKNQEDLVATDRHILRSILLGKYYQYMELGYLPVFERSCVSMLYEDYKLFEGNGFITDLVTQLMALPSELEKKEE